MRTNYIDAGLKSLNDFIKPDLGMLKINGNRLYVFQVQSLTTGEIGYCLDHGVSSILGMRTGFIKAMFKEFGSESLNIGDYWISMLNTEKGFRNICYEQKTKTLEERLEVQESIMIRLLLQVEKQASLIDRVTVILEKLVTKQ